MWQSRLILALACAALLALALPAPRATLAQTAPDTGPLQVYAAPVFGPVLQDVSGAYLTANGSVSLQTRFGAPNQLIPLLRAGGTADVVALDDPAQLQALQAANLIDGEPRVFARTRLTLITAASDAKQIAELKDLARPGVRWITGLPNLPVSAATGRMLDRANSLPDYGPTFRAQVEQNVLMRLGTADDVLERIADGEGDAAVMYGADVPLDARKLVRVIDIPDEINELVDYSIAVLKGPNTIAARSFVSYVVSPPAQTTFAKYGFVSPPVAVVEALDEAATAAYSPTFEVRGLVTAPHRFSRAELALLPQESLSVTYQTDAGPERATFTGTRLLNVFNAAGGAKLPADVNNAKLRVSVTVSGADGSEVIFGWGALDPDFGALDVLVAIARDGEPLGDGQGMARLIVPGDRLAGRMVPAITRIELRDPGPQLP